MIKNFLKIAWRNLVKNKAHSLINIIGLSTGMAVAILIGLWMWSELSFNRNFENYNNIAQVKQHVTNNGEVQTWDNVPYPLAEELRKNYGSDFKRVVMVANMDDHIITLDANKMVTTNGGFMDADGVDMLSLQMVTGDARALTDPSYILISEATAKAYFGTEYPLNKTLKIDNQILAKVAGVYKDIPQNSTFGGLGFIGSWQMFYNNTEWVRTIGDPWRPNAFTLYVQMADHADLAAVSNKIRDVKLHKVNAHLAKKKPALFLQPMNRWHLYNDYRNGKNVGGRIQYVWMFGIIGVFVLLLACINFMNLSTARSEKRAREVGIRKAIGSVRWQLIWQFFSESLLCTFLALLLAILLAQLSLPFFNAVADKQMTILWAEPVFWLSCLGFALFTGVIAGIYPALYLSSFEPVKVLKGTFRVGRLAALPRQVLVVVQFVVSIGLIIGTIVVFQQIQHAKDRPVGYNREGLVSIPMNTGDIAQHFEPFKADLMKTGAISSAAIGDVAPTSNAGSTSGMEWPGKDPNLSTDILQSGVTQDYGNVVGWKFIAGRNFSRAFGTDSVGLVLNEAAAHFMNFKNPVGQTIIWWGKPYRVIGVIKDVISDSPYSLIRPSVYFLNPNGGTVMVRINPQISSSKALKLVEPVFKRYNPQQPFVYHFVDELYNNKFLAEQRIGKLAACFSALAIFISCLGLFGMASFMAEQRVKEIGVRKVLGASVFNLWRLLSTDFVRLVMIALVISSPLAWYVMHNWLQGFDYRSAISGWVFVLTGAMALSITVLTVSFQSVRAALANPVKSLRSE